MKKIIVTTAVLAVAGLGLTGCGLGGDSGASEATTTTAALTTPTTVASAVLKTTDTPLGSVIADSEGHTLYAFTKDTQFGPSTCFDACATSWPAAKVTEQGLVGEGIDSSLIGAVIRKDGGKQLTINGWPLYTFAGDAGAAGAIKGQGNKGVWYLVGTNGKLIKTAAPGATTAAPTTSTVKPSASTSATKGQSAGSYNYNNQY